MYRNSLILLSKFLFSKRHVIKTIREVGGIYGMEY